MSAVQVRAPDTAVRAVRHFARTLGGALRASGWRPYVDPRQHALDDRTAIGVDLIRPSLQMLLENGVFTILFRWKPDGGYFMVEWAETANTKLVSSPRIRHVRFETLQEGLAQLTEYLADNPGAKAIGDVDERQALLWASFQPVLGEMPRALTDRTTPAPVRAAPAAPVRSAALEKAIALVHKQLRGAARVAAAQGTSVDVDAVLDGLADYLWTQHNVARDTAKRAVAVVRAEPRKNPRRATRASRMPRTRRVPRRVNGIVQVPEAWVNAVLAVLASRVQLEKIYLGLRAFPYETLTAKLAALYPDGVPVMVNKGVPRGIAASMSTKDEDGAYWLSISTKRAPAQTASDVRHELRHLVQMLADETGVFSRAGRKETRVLERVAPGEAPTGSYYRDASEWQPLIGTLADSIVVALAKKPPATVALRNSRILDLIKKSKFYQGTDPRTHRALLSQVYAEVDRQVSHARERR